MPLVHRLTAIATVVVVVGGQVPVPARHAGFVYGCGRENAPIQFDLFIDLLCDDSKAAFPTVLRVADYYGPGALRLRTFLFPLPFKRNSFVATKGAHAVDIITKGNLTYTWFATLFNNIPGFADTETRNVSYNNVLDSLAGLATEIGVPEDQFRQHIASSNVEALTRNGWKYVCTRSVAATPTFMINGIEVRQAQSTWSDGHWRQVVDSLLANTAYEIYAGGCAQTGCSLEVRCEPYSADCLNDAQTTRRTSVVAFVIAGFAGYIASIVS